MALGWVFVIAFAASFGLLLGCLVVVRRTVKRRRRKALERLLRARASVYAQMNALFEEYQGLGRLSREERIEAMSPSPESSPAGLLFADVRDRLKIVGQEVEATTFPQDLRPVSMALLDVIRVSLQGLDETLEAVSPEAFVEALPSAAPTMTVEPLRRLDAELRPLAQSEGLTEEEYFYHDARLYI